MMADSSLSSRVRFSGDLPYGVMTSCMPFLTLEESLNLISSIGGVQEVELSAVDSEGKRAADKSDHVASHLPLYDFIDTPYDTACNFADLFNKHGLGVTLGNYDRIHSGNYSEERLVLNYMLKVVDFAGALGGRDGGAYGVNVGMFWGWNRRDGIQKNLDDIAAKVTLLAKYAEERNVAITTENCHMPGGWPEDNEESIPQQVMRSAGSTLAGRLYIIDKVLSRGVKPEYLGLTWDPSHPETEATDPLVEAQIAFSLEPITMIHLKGHNQEDPTEMRRRAYFGGPAMPGWFAPKYSQFYRKLVDLGVPIADNAWAQQYGRVTLPGNGYSKTPTHKLLEIARFSGFSGRVIAENETLEKNFAVQNKDLIVLSAMYANCRDAVKKDLWAGTQYRGREFKPLDVKRDGRILPSMTWTEAVQHYGED